MASTPSAALAEAYVMRKLHKEKMKSMEITPKDEKQIRETSDGGFFGMFKKIHPAPDSSRKGGSAQG
ncbi:Transcription factor 7-like [Actinidia chinensis var. chinensis]|uniref:Transcription factor 7-like n=1 Tax=Actinidia chinensis var. chinensis TaxID=1590841 RepID=A0A2R6R2S1_ACTCC|nr:Transcription factor 7-like [Actinidia chinensis var. chinensis]